MQHASLLIKSDVFIFNSASQTTTGLWLASDPFIRIEKNASAKLIIEKLFEVLNNSHQAIPHPTDWKNFNKTYIHSMGYKTLRKLYEDAKLCNIIKDNNIIEFKPYKLDLKGSKKYFSRISDMSPIKINSSEPIEKIHLALIAAITKCE